MKETPVEFYRHCLGAEEQASIKATLESIFITLGPRTAEFEKRFAEYLGIPQVIGVNSCSNGLVLALHALGVGDGDEVITTPMTFIATSNAALHVGADVRFADCDPRTGLIDPAAVRAAITPKTKAIIAVHLYGQLADMRALRAIADEHGLKLVEDAAHAVESEKDGVRTAQLADATCFSFYATKNVTSGDGGAIAVHDEALAVRLRHLRNHGMTKDAATRYGQRYTHWDMTELGYKCVMKDLEAALLLPQLPHIEARRALRQALVERYEARLRSVPGVELVERSGKSAHHLMAILVPEAQRDRVLAELGARKIGCGVNYRAVHTLSYYRERYGFRAEDFPHAARFGARTVTLPLWPYLPPEQVDVVVEALREILAEQP